MRHEIDDGTTIVTTLALTPLLAVDNEPANATLYGRTLKTSEIVTKGVRPPTAAAKLLELLNRYSAKERTN